MHFENPTSKPLKYAYVPQYKYTYIPYGPEKLFLEVEPNLKLIMCSTYIMWLNYVLFD